MKKLNIKRPRWAKLEAYDSKSPSMVDLRPDEVFLEMTHTFGWAQTILDENRVAKLHEWLGQWLQQRRAETILANMNQRKRDK